MYLITFGIFLTLIFFAIVRYGTFFKLDLKFSLISKPSTFSRKEFYKVKKVIDGDTIILENGEKVRYIGIDTPEIIRNGRFLPECFALESKRVNEKLVLGKKVRLEKDVSERDRYGRLLRYVYVGDVFVNEYLVKEGYAKAVSFPPDVKYQEKLRNAERYARENKKGLWAEDGC